MRKSDSNLILLIFLTSFWNYVGAAGKYVIPCLTVHEVIKENWFQKTEGYSSFNSSHWISSGMIWTDHEFSVLAKRNHHLIWIPSTWKKEHMSQSILYRSLLNWMRETCLAKKILISSGLFCSTTMAPTKNKKLELGLLRAQHACSALKSPLEKELKFTLYNLLVEKHNYCHLDCLIASIA